MSFNSRDWTRSYEQAKRDIQRTRQQEKVFTSTEKESVQTSLDTLESQLKIMSSAPMEYQVAGSELSRRRVLLKNLRGQMAKAVQMRPLNTAGAGTVNSAGMSGVKGASSSSSSSYSGGSGGGGGGGGGTTNPMQSSAGLAMRQEQVIKLQDDMLLDIADGVDRLRDKALVINQEVNLQGKLITDLEDNVEIGITGLQQEAEHAKKVREKSQTFYMYVCLLLEFCLLMLLIFIAFVH
jgi:hypothetical protein